jgi:hypothetical protein
MEEPLQFPLVTALPVATLDTCRAYGAMARPRSQVGSHAVRSGRIERLRRGAQEPQHIPYPSRKRFDGVQQETEVIK